MSALSFSDWKLMELWHLFWVVMEFLLDPFTILDICDLVVFLTFNFWVSLTCMGAFIASKECLLAFRVLKPFSFLVW